MPRTYAYTTIEACFRHLVGSNKGVVMVIGIQNSGLTSRNPVASILIAGSKADGRGPRKGEEWETNPLELTFFFSTR